MDQAVDRGFEPSVDNLSLLGYIERLAMMQADDKVVYACTTRLHAGAMLLEPLANKTLVRDLVTEIAPPKERLDSLAE